MCGPPWFLPFLTHVYTHFLSFFFFCVYVLFVFCFYFCLHIRMFIETLVTMANFLKNLNVINREPLFFFFMYYFPHFLIE